MAKRLYVIKTSSVKRTLAMAVLLILVGVSLISPFRAQASSNLYYLYPYPSNNPAQTSLFWSEAEPEMGAFNLGMWRSIAPGRQLVIGLPQGYQINSAMLGNNLGKYITAKIGNRLSSGKRAVEVNVPKSAPKDSITYKRKITADGIEEEIKVEVGEHFKGNDNFEKYLETIKKNLTNKDELPDREIAPLVLPVPVPEDSEEVQAAKVQLLGGGLILSGALMLFKLLPLLAL